MLTYADACRRMPTYVVACQGGRRKSLQTTSSTCGCGRLGHLRTVFLVAPAVQLPPLPDRVKRHGGSFRYGGTQFTCFTRDLLVQTCRRLTGRALWTSTARSGGSRLCTVLQRRSRGSAAGRGARCSRCRQAPRVAVGPDKTRRAHKFGTLQAIGFFF
jgi:hypothetical protein